MNNEPQIRLFFFFGTFLIMFLWELISPQKKLEYKKSLRWMHNILLVLLNTLLIRFLLIYSAVEVAEFTLNNQLGLFNALTFSYEIKTILSVIFLDLIIYCQHVVFHKVPILWKLHRMHHADLDYDVTTGLRFHPIEIILSMIIKSYLSRCAPPDFE